MILISAISILSISAISMVVYFNHLSIKQRKEIKNIIETQKTDAFVRRSTKTESVKENALAEAI